MQTPLTLTALLALTALVVLPLPAGADGDTADSVTIVVEAPPKLLSSHEGFAWTLTLDWADAAALNTTGDPTALDLLEHIVAVHGSTRTLGWYDLDGDGTPDSAFVDEVNGVATDFTLVLVGYFWALYENDESATVGINQIAADPGDVIRLTYTGYPADA